MATLLYANDNTTLVGSMLTDGGSLTNGAVDDTTSGPTESEVSDQDPDGDPCGNVANAIAYQQAVWDGGSLHNITAIRRTGRCRTAIGFGSECISPPSSPVKAHASTLYYATSPTGPVGGAGWTLLDSDAMTDGAFVSHAWAGNITARYIGVLLTANYWIDQTDSEITARSQNTDLRVTGSVLPPCSIPDGDQELPRGAKRGLDITGAVPPTIDEWEIYRCVGGMASPVDASDLSSSGLNGWLIAISSPGSGSDYDIYAPPSAAIARDYEARIDRGGGLFHSINFGVIASIEAGDIAMPGQRPSAREQFVYGFENAMGTPVAPNRRSRALTMSQPDPVIPSTKVTEQGSDGVVTLITNKEHVMASLAGELGYQDLIEQLYFMLGAPFIKSVPGASQARDVIFHIVPEKQDDFKTFTCEQGLVASREFPSRFDSGNNVGLTLTLGKTSNRMEMPLIGRELDESINYAAVGTPTEVPFVAVAAKANAHYIGTSVAHAQNGASELCDTHQVTITLPTRRNPLFTQCSTEGSWQDMIQVQAEKAITIELSHRSTSRAYMTQIRNKQVMGYRFFNRGPEIEANFYNELEIVCPFQFDDPGRGNTDGVTTGVHPLVPVRDANFNPFGVGTPGGDIAIRIRAAWSAIPSAPTI